MKTILFTIFLNFYCVSMYTQNTYYVSTTGNNSNNGSNSMPWLTIQYATSQLSPGDTLLIKSGSYLGKINLTQTGYSGQEITIKNFQNDNVVIEGSTLSNYEYLLKIEGINYINIKGLKFQNYQKLDAQGIVVINSDNISIINNEFSNIDYDSNAIGQIPVGNQNSQPIIVYGRDNSNPCSNILIKGNTIFDCEVGFSECLSVNGNVDNFEISNNHIFNNTNIPIVAIGHEGECSNPALDQARNGLIKNNLIHDNPSAYASAGGIYIDGAKSIFVENNISFNNDYGIEIGCENNGGAPNDPSASDIKIRNNLIYNNKKTGIALGGYDYPTTGKVTTTEITNNTCYNNDTDNDYNGEIVISYVENSIIKNNIFYTKNSEKVLIISSETNPSLTVDYNVYFSPTGSDDIVIEIDGFEYNEFDSYQTGTSLDLNSHFVNPNFINESLANLDLHLDVTSLAIDNGDPNFIADPNEHDMDQDPRVNNIVDCGADEYYTTSTAHIFLEPTGLTILPNSFTDKVIVDGNLTNFQISVYDNIGTLITDYSGHTSPITIDLSMLGSGLYYISVQHQSLPNLSIYKIIKM